MKKLRLLSATALFGIICGVGVADAQNNDPWTDYNNPKSTSVLKASTTQPTQSDVPYFYAGKPPETASAANANYANNRVASNLTGCDTVGGCDGAPTYAAPQNYAPLGTANSGYGHNSYSRAMSAPWPGQDVSNCSSGMCGTGIAPRRAGFWHSRARASYGQGVGRDIIGSQGQWFGGLNALTFIRNDADKVVLTYPTGAPATQALTTRSADNNLLFGAELTLGRHLNNGLSVVGSYWGLFSEGNEAIYTGAPVVALPTIDQLDYDSGAGVDTVASFMSSPGAVAHRTSLKNEFHNVELNFLRRTLVHGCNRDRKFDIFAGARYLRIDEEFQFATAYDAANFGADDRDLFYNIDTENNLYGLQLGGATNYALSQRLTFRALTKLGVFANSMKHQQRIYGNNGDAMVNAGAYAGDAYNIESEREDVAMVGEIDLSLRYALNNCWNFNIGYRAVGINGIALSTDQIPRNFADLNEVRHINSNGSMILHGAYVGMNYNY